MIAVIYDDNTGAILYTVQGTEANIKADGLPYLIVEEYRLDYAQSHMVVDGALVERHFVSTVYQPLSEPTND
jgi:hypothetical protein